MRLPIRLLISASFIVGAVSAAHAQSFAEKEFPELRKPKPVAVAPAPAPTPAPAAVPVAPAEKPTLIKTTPMPFAAAPAAPVQKLDPPLPPVPPKSVRVIPMPDAKSASKIAVAATPEPAPEIEEIAAEPHAPPRRVKRKVVRHTAPPPVAVVSVRATGGMGNLDALRMPPGINSIQLGYGGNPPDMSAWADATGFHGSPPFRAADQQRSFTPNCGFVFHRFFDELGASVDRPVRICN